MRRKISLISELEHITSKELGDHLDEVLERITAEDIALVIDHEDNSYVLCPANWFDLPEMKHLEILVKNSVRYAALVDDSELPETIEMVLEFLPMLSEACVTSLLETINGKGDGSQWLVLKQKLEEELMNLKKGEP